MGKIKLIVGALILLFGSLSAQAAKLQIDYLMLEADLEDVDEFEPDALQLKIINPVGPGADVVGVFAFGASDDEIEEFDPFFGPVSLSVDLATMFGIYFRAHGDLGANGQIFGQLGLVQLEYDLDAEISGLSGSESYDDTGLAFGFGASFGLSDQAALVIEYNQLPDVDVEDIADIETTSLSVGLQVSF
ncbi:MAG: porin family protein [Woeseia sp.]|nr:porin family protein [Woeseia sp.]